MLQTSQRQARLTLAECKSPPRSSAQLVVIVPAILPFDVVVQDDLNREVKPMRLGPSVWQ